MNIIGDGDKRISIDVSRKPGLKIEKRRRNRQPDGGIENLQRGQKRKTIEKTEQSDGGSAHRKEKRCGIDHRQRSVVRRDANKHACKPGRSEERSCREGVCKSGEISGVDVK